MQKKRKSRQTCYSFSLSSHQMAVKIPGSATPSGRENGRCQEITTDHGEPHTDQHHAVVKPRRDGRHPGRRVPPRYDGGEGALRARDAEAELAEVVWAGGAEPPRWAAVRGKENPTRGLGWGWRAGYCVGGWGPLAAGKRGKDAVTKRQKNVRGIIIPPC